MITFIDKDIYRCEYAGVDTLLPEEGSDHVPARVTENSPLRPLIPRNSPNKAELGLLEQSLICGPELGISS